MLQRFIVLVTAALALGCGTTNNVADCAKPTKHVPCSQRTPLENAQIAMDQSDFPTAITLLTQIVASQPGDYDQDPMLAAAYAGRSGLDLFSLASSQFNSSSSSLLSELGSFLPTPATKGAAYSSSLADMLSATVVLDGIPADFLQTISTDKYAASAVLQSSLYHACYAAMLVNEFAQSETTGAFDPAKLATMSEADAVSILQNLAAAGAVPGLSTNPALAAEITAQLATINGQSGATTKAKLDAFIAAQNGASASSTGTGTGTSSL